MIDIAIEEFGLNLTSNLSRKFCVSVVIRVTSLKPNSKLCNQYLSLSLATIIPIWLILTRGLIVIIKGLQLIPHSRHLGRFPSLFLLWICIVNEEIVNQIDLKVWQTRHKMYYDDIVLSLELILMWCVISEPYLLPPMIAVFMLETLKSSRRNVKVVC